MKPCLLILAFAISSSSTVCAQYGYQRPIAVAFWETEDLRTNGADTVVLNQLMEQMHRIDHDIHSLVVVQHGKLVLEDYFGGYDAETIHDLRSTTKSVLSLLMGIAVDKGYVRSIDEPFMNYLPGHQINKNDSPQKRKITIKDLLTMSSGLDCNDWDSKSKGQEDKVYKRKNWMQQTLDLPQIYASGDTAMYCTMGTVLVARVIEESSGLSIADFASHFLFEPLGITDVSWKHTTDREDIPSAAKRLYMLPRDMAKLGQLVLDHGVWQGDSLVSADWITASTSKQTTLSGIDYGYLWWQIPLEKDGILYPMTTATGNGGQYIMVLPSLDMVAVFTGGAYNSEKDKLPFVLMRNAIIPMLEP
ncbi:CubicO group peptidase, beta-lactamase class C family [Reichenbachiella agariperforans]|uniref:CubicO group peptidase, beta-lactamase class C family n=1 Tax=Reichenbachiella agariperforans TaxID=156994 RepID=A0A1M6N1H7_REIAG|nr:serine hydrolase [Reichenbachiella agariperforans]SHJ89567.1 CubicO group peptidase, beta-lactamase class C family [Reichenbachiella agariperforans]